MHSRFYKYFMACYLHIAVKKTPSFSLYSTLITALFLLVFSFNSTANNLQEIAINSLDSNILKAKRSQLKFSQLTTSDGLSNSNVFSITQDHQGFIWVATSDGLNRFDGNNFVTYRYNATNKNSIANNFIRKIFIDNQNILWIGTQNGLSRYNRELDNFDNFFNNPNDQDTLRDNVIWDIYQNRENISEAKQGTPLLWVSTTEGLHTVKNSANLDEIKFERIKVRNYDDRIREIKTIFQDKQQNYWLGSFDKGIHILSKTLNYIGSLKKQNKFNLDINANALFDMKIVDNNYWLATDNGLFIVDDRYQLITHYTENPKQANNSQSLLSNNIRAITQYDENHVWLATHNGLNTINLSNASKNGDKSVNCEPM